MAALMSGARIERVVVLMFENRSFDHLLGHLDHAGLPPITEGAVNLLDPADPSSTPFATFPYDSDFDVRTDPGHSHADIVCQLQGDGPTLRPDDIAMNGFVKDYLARLPADGKDRVREIMGWHTAAQAPALAELAREFTVCSRWFSSVPGETWPNRMFAHSGFSHGLVHNDVKLYDDRVVFDALGEAGKSWVVYAGDIPQAACYLSLVDTFKHRLTNMESFYEDVEDGTLPAYSFIEPRHLLSINSQHPDASVLRGDQLLRQVYNALAAKQEIWDSLMLIVTWDEHGGFFDRVPPPEATPPVAGQAATVTTDTGTTSFGFDRLGVRVPAVVISPWSPRGAVSDAVFDHSSIVKTVYDVFDLPGHLLERDRVAASVAEVLTGSERRDPVVLGSAPHPEVRAALVAQAAGEAGATVSADAADGGVPPLDAFQTSLLDLKARLDEHQGLPAAAGPDTAQGMAPEAGVDLRRQVYDFQARHLSSRGERLLQDDRFPSG